MDQYKDRSSVFDAREHGEKESTLLPMLLAGLILVVIGAGVVMTVV